MRVTDVICHVLLDPGYERDATSSAQDDIVVEVCTDEGITGIGETDLNAWVARACIEAPGTHTMDLGLRELLIGQDPTDVEALWERLYVGSAMTGRRGAVVHALGALDIALWDIRGKAEGRPVWELLGDPAREHLTPYASLLPEEREYDAFAAAMVEDALWARDRGFSGAKMELLLNGPYASNGLDEPDEAIVEIVAAVRAAVGAGFELMVDVAYAWGSDVERALRCIEALAPHGVRFVETPLWPDDLDAHARLCARSPIPIASGEWLSTRFEFLDLMDRGGVQVIQPDVGRVGGITEMARICALAAERGREIVPHGWKTGITIAATAQLAAVCPELTLFEFVPQPVAGSALRRELTVDELVLEHGRIPLPGRPGIGVELDRGALDRFADAARRHEAARSGGAPASPGARSAA
jgi:L-alanine-DL-glutamate epimerase-like enolase superfamily enzyme